MLETDRALASDSQSVVLIGRGPKRIYWAVGLIIISVLWIVPLTIVTVALTKKNDSGSVLTTYFKTRKSTDFSVIPLGSGGGPFQSDLSSYLIGAIDQAHPATLPITFGSFDCGTLLSGLKIADNNGLLKDVNVPSNSTLTRLGYVAQESLKYYFLSHPHLDHVTGLVIDSPVLGGSSKQKGVVGLNSTLQSVSEYLFNWQTWPNMGNSGLPPLLSQFNYIITIPNTTLQLPTIGLNVTLFPTNHGGMISTAFLIESQGTGKYMMYWGDVGPDSVQNTTLNRVIWNQVAPLVDARLLQTIIVEVSYTNSQPDNLLFGHLTPKYLMEELHTLASFLSVPDVLRDMIVFVSHIKPTLNQGPAVRSVIKQELDSSNDLQIQFIYPEQGVRYDV